MRWADMDMLGHVNNVSYVDYLQEARIELFAAHDAFHGRNDQVEGVVVVDYRVDFMAPLVFRRRPIKVDVWVSEIRGASFELSYEVYDERDGERTLYLAASSRLAPFVFATERPRRITDEEKVLLARYVDEPVARAPIGGPPTAATHVSPLRVRFSDLDVFQHANNVKYFEFFQESRIKFMIDIATKGDVWTEDVVARTDIEYRRPIHFRRAPYDVHNWISHVGSRSFSISSEIRDDDLVLARAHVVLVGFDPETQKSTEMNDGQRASLMRAWGREA